METKVPLFWGKGDLDKVSLNSISIFFFSFFRIPKKVVERFMRLRVGSCGGKLRPAKDCLGELGDSLSPKRKRWIGHPGFGEIQLCSTWKMS